MTHTCVTFTADGAFLRGDTPTVAAAACATRAPSGAAGEVAAATLHGAAGEVAASTLHAAALATIGDLHAVVASTTADFAGAPVDVA